MNGPCMCGAIDCLSCGPAQGYDPLYERYRASDAWQREFDEAMLDGYTEEEAEQIIYERWKEEGK